jgi:hypothetical protein
MSAWFNLNFCGDFYQVAKQSGGGEMENQSVQLIFKLSDVSNVVFINCSDLLAKILDVGFLRVL